jgi:flagellar biosynthesis protein FlhA
MFIRMTPQAVENLCRLIGKEVEKLTTTGHVPILLVSPQIRAALRQITSSHLPQLVILSYNEITRDTKIDSLAMVTEK